MRKDLKDVQQNYAATSVGNNRPCALKPHIHGQYSGFQGHFRFTHIVYGESHIFVDSCRSLYQETCIFLRNGSILEDLTSWVPAVLVFEEEQSYLGKEVRNVSCGKVMPLCIVHPQLILDFSNNKNLRVRRVLNLNVSAGGVSVGLAPLLPSITPVISLPVFCINSLCSLPTFHAQSRSSIKKPTPLSCDTHGPRASAWAGNRARLEVLKSAAR